MTTIGTVPADAVTNLVKIGSTSGVDHGGQVILAVGDDVWEGDRIHLKILIAVKRKNV
jgi:hypothetical protein